MRGSRQEQKGAAGAHEVSAEFERLGWGVAGNPDHDLGTDLYLAPRDDRLVDLALMAGAQVKSGDATDPGKYFREPKRDKTGAVVGWWYRESTRKHFDYWVNHRVPHLLILHDLDLRVSFWIHVTEDRVTYLKKGAKIFVPADQTLDADHAQALLEVASEQRSQTSWEGSWWTGLSNLSPTHLYRYALLAPRLVAPHPNRSVSQLGGAAAIALLVLGREPRYRAANAAQVDLAKVDASSPWEWQLAAGLRSYIRKLDRRGLAIALDAANEPHQQAASAVALALAHMEADDIAAAAATLDAVLDRDQLETVDHGWLSLQRARARFEAGEMDLAREESLRLIGLSAQAPHDLTATAISGAAANLLFAASDWETLDFAKTLAATDTTVTWWRQQVLGWGRGQRVEDEFKRWAHDGTTQHRFTEAWDHTRAASLIAGFVGDHGAWRGALNELAQHMLIISQDDHDDVVVENALRTQRTVGAHKELALAANWLIATGPADVVKRVADGVQLDHATVSTLHADLALLTAAGDILDPSRAEAITEWGMRVFEDPACLTRLRPQFDVQSSIVGLLAGLTTALPKERHPSLLRWAMGARPEHPAIVARQIRALIVNLDEGAWDMDMAMRATACADEHETPVRYALLRGARRCMSEVREKLIAEALEGGSADAEWALGPVADFSEDLVLALRDRAMDLLQAPRPRGVRFRGQSQTADTLTLLNICHPQLADWEPVLESLEAVDADGDASRVLERLSRRADDLPDDVTERLAALAQRIQDLPSDRDVHQWHSGDFRASARALAIALERKAKGSLPLASMMKLAAGDRSARQLAALLCGKEDTKTAGLLAAFAADTDPYVRATTASVLVHRVAHGEQHLFDLLKASLDDRGTAVAKLAASEFADHPTRELVPLFESLVAHASGEVRQKVHTGLQA